MNSYKFNISHLLILLVVLIMIFAIWKYNTINEKLTFLPQNDLYGNIVSGKDNIDFVQNNNNSIQNTPPPYRQLPMEDNAIYITGMNQYLWDKSKKKRNN